MKHILLYLSAFYFTSVSAKATTCQNGSTSRRVEVVFAEVENKLPCKVSYFKDTEEQGKETTLWTAQNDASFCESKAAEFVEKLASMGWNCGGPATTAQQGATAPTEPVAKGR